MTLKKQARPDASSPTGPGDVAATIPRAPVEEDPTSAPTIAAGGSGTRTGGGTIPVMTVLPTTAVTGGAAVTGIVLGASACSADHRIDSAPAPATSPPGRPGGPS